MEAQSWNQVRLTTVGVIEILPGDKYKGEDPDTFRHALLAADQSQPWRSPSVDGVALPSIADLQGPITKIVGPLRFQKFMIRPPVLLLAPQLNAYHRYLMGLAKVMIGMDTPKVDLVHASLEIQSYSQSFTPGSPWPTPAWPYVTFRGQAMTSDGFHIPTKGMLGRMMRENPSSVVFKAEIERPTEPAEQIQIVGRPIDDLLSGRFTGDMLPKGVLIYVQGPDFYSRHGRRKYSCTVWRSSRNNLRVG